MKGSDVMDMRDILTLYKEFEVAIDLLCRRQPPTLNHEPMKRTEQAHVDT